MSTSGKILTSTALAGLVIFTVAASMFFTGASATAGLSAATKEIFVNSATGSDPSVISSAYEPYEFNFGDNLRITVNGEKDFYIMFPQGKFTALEVDSIIMGQAPDHIVAADPKDYYDLSQRRRVKLTTKTSGMLHPPGFRYSIEATGGSANEILQFDTDFHVSGKGSKEEPFATPQFAFDAIKFYGKPFRIIAAPGTYIGDLQLKKANSNFSLEIEGEIGLNYSMAKFISDNTLLDKYGKRRNNGLLTSMSCTIRTVELTNPYGNGFFTSAPAHLEECYIHDCKGSGAIIPCTAGSNSNPPSIKRCLIAENGGKGIDLGHVVQEIRDNIICNNDSYGIWAYCGSMAHITNNLVIWNGINMEGDGGICLVHVDNSWEGHGGDCFNDPLTAEISGNTIAENNGDGLRFQYFCAPTGCDSGAVLMPVIANNIIAENSGCGCIGVKSEASPEYCRPIFMFNDTVNNFECDYSIPPYYRDPTGTNGNLSEEPLFEMTGEVEIIPGHYLHKESPCIAAGGSMVQDPGYTRLPDPDPVYDAHVDNLDMGYHHHDYFNEALFGWLYGEK